jgi:hypothetical protein
MTGHRDTETQSSEISSQLVKTTSVPLRLCGFVSVTDVPAR